MSQTSYSPTDSSDSDADIPSTSASTHSGSDDDEEDDAEFEDAQEYSHPHTHTHTHTHTPVPKTDESQSQSQSQSQAQELSTHMTSTTTQDTSVTSQSQAQAFSIPSSSRIDSSTVSTASISQSPSPPLSRPTSVTASPSPSPSPSTSTSTSTSTTHEPTHDLPAPTTSSTFPSRSISDPTTITSPSKSDLIPSSSSIHQSPTHDNNSNNNDNNNHNNNNNNTSNNNIIPQPLQNSFKDGSRSISVPTSVGSTNTRNTSMSGSYGSSHPPGAEGVFIVKNLDTGEVCDLDEAEIMFPEVRRVYTTLDLKTFDEATAARQPHAETESPDKDPDMKRKKETLGFFNKMLQVFGAGTTGSLKSDRASNQVKVKTHHKPVQEFNDVRLVQVIYPHNGPIWALSYNHDGAFLATGGQDSIVRVFATHNTIAAKELADAKLDQGNDEAPELPKGVGRRVISPTPFRTYAGHKSDVIDLAWSKANFLLSASIDKTVRLWHVSRVQCLCLFQHTDFVTSVSFHPLEDRYFLSGSFDKKLRIWNIPEHRVVEWAQTPQIITACSFAPDGNKAAAGLYNGQVVFYQTRGLKYFTQIECKNRHGKYRKGKKVTGLQFAPDGKHLLITTNDSRVRLYDMDDYSMIAKFKGLSNDELQIRASFNADGRYIISGSEDESVYVWNVHQHTTTSPPPPQPIPSTPSTSISTNTTEYKINGTHTHTTPPTQVHTLPTIVNNTQTPSTTTTGIDPLAALLAALGGQPLPTPSSTSTISATSISTSTSDLNNGHPHLTVPTTSTTIAPAPAPPSPSPVPSPSASPPSSTSNSTSTKHELEKNDSYEYFKACSHTVTCAKFTPTNTILLSLGLVADVPTSQSTDESSHSPPQHTTPSGHSDTLTPPITPSSHHLHARHNSNSVPSIPTPTSAVAGTASTLAQASSMAVDHIIVAAGYNGELKFFHAKR